VLDSVRSTFRASDRAPRGVATLACAGLPSPPGPVAFTVRKGGERRARVSRRGTYRGIYSSLPDDPDFQQLTPQARLVFYTLRCCAAAGLGCIFRYYLDLVAAQSGLPANQVRRALSELQAADWIRIEEPILWIRNGLRYSPNISLADEKHRKAIQWAIAALPHREIVLTFCEYYDLPRPFPRPSVGASKQEEEKSKRSKREEEEYPPVVPLTGDPKIDQLEIPAKMLERVPSLARWPAVQSLIGLWNDHASRYGYPKVESLSPARRTKAQAALRAFPDWRFWNGAFFHVRVSRFLSGQTAPANGHSASFRADFDWFLAKAKDGTENVVKVNEGRYDDKDPR
jgi:hypothetical protein